MSTTRRLATVIGMSLLVGSMMSSALAAAKRTAGASQSDVRQLLRMMDTDKNGAVSKDEFLQYMSQTFDRRDVNRSRQLERGEMTTSPFPLSRRTGAAAQSDVRRLTRIMDKDANGRVSKSEFMQYMSQTFDRLDVNKSGQLEPDELRHLPAGQRCAESGSC